MAAENGDPVASASEAEDEGVHPAEDLETSRDAGDHAAAEASHDESADEPKPRLAIAKLRLENFKSYGGVVDVGPFHKSFSAVVGPNGSGKSNVIDAMLFVFGRRAKQLRHSKLRELLHHSNTYPNVSSATVTVFFHEIVDTGDGDMDFDVVDGSAFSVARRAFKNDTSKYYLNEKEVKMGTVVDLLKSKGVDLDNNRFLILQGEVEQIAMMKPKAQTAHEDGLLEYLEDIIGSNRHVEAILESGKEVEALNEERAHKLNRVKAAERERDNLEDAKTEAEDYVDKERSLISKRLRLTRDRLRKRAANLKDQEDATRAAQEKLDESRLALSDALAQVDVLTRDFNTKKKEADSISGQLNTAKEKYASSDRADIQIGTDLKALKAKEKKLRSAVERETARAEKAQEDISRLENEVAAAEADILRLEGELAAASKKLERVHAHVREMTKPLRSELEEKQEELLPFKDRVNSCQRNVDVTRSERDLLTEALNAPIVALDSANARLAALNENLEGASQKRAVVAERRVEVRKMSDSSSASLNKARREHERVRSAVSDLRRKLEEAKQNSESSASCSRLFSALYSASRQGKLKGIVGRLGDLGTIKEEYSIAAGAAAGSTLDNMVVQTAEDAQACISFMRQHNLGRSTFIILEKLAYLEQKMARREFDGPRLFDHVAVDDETNRIAFYFALRDTLVARNLEDARRMAFKPTRLNRVVTVEGELIESSGAMTGGGRGPPRYRLASRGRGYSVMEAPDPAEAAQLARSLEEMLEREKEFNIDIERLQAETRSSAAELEGIQTEFVKASNIVESIESQISEVTSKSLPDLKRAAALARKTRADKRHPDMQRLSNLEKALLSNERDLASAKEACVGLETSIAAIQEKIVAAGGEELQLAKSDVDRCQSEISEKRSAAAGGRSRATSARKNANVAQKNVGKAETEISEIESNREKLLAKRAALEEEAAVLTDSFKALEAQHDRAKEEVSKIAEEHTRVKNELKACRQAEVPLVEALNDAKRMVSQGKSDLQEMGRSIKSLSKQMQDLDEALADADLADPGQDSARDPVSMESDPMVDSDGHSDAGATDEVQCDDSNIMETDNIDEEDYLSAEELSKLEVEISSLHAELRNSKPNLGAIAEYRKKSTEYKAQVDELDAISARRDSARKENDRLRKARLDEFMQGFSIITMKLKELYQMITLGGDAELELVDSLDPFSEGIVFSVRPPKKSWKNISNLSGGEKTLSSLALVFALHHFKPTPLYFLDEIDAALDFKNVSIVANYVKDRTKNAQFIIISLRNNMFELADRLVGIYKTHNTTKSVTVNPKAFVIPAATASAQQGVA